MEFIEATYARSRATLLAVFGTMLLISGCSAAPMADDTSEAAFPNNDDMFAWWPHTRMACEDCMTDFGFVVRCKLPLDRPAERSLAPTIGKALSKHVKSDKSSLPVALQFRVFDYNYGDGTIAIRAKYRASESGEPWVACKLLESRDLRDGVVSVVESAITQSTVGKYKCTAQLITDLFAQAP